MRLADSSKLFWFVIDTDVTNIVVISKHYEYWMKMYCLLTDHSYNGLSTCVMYYFMQSHLTCISTMQTYWPSQAKQSKTTTIFIIFISNNDNCLQINCNNAIKSIQINHRMKNLLTGWIDTWMWYWMLNVLYRVQFIEFTIQLMLLQSKLLNTICFHV